MEDAANFDKIINSSQKLIPKRLSFDFLNNTSSSIAANESSIHKKRKFTDMVDQEQSKRDEINESLNSSTSSFCSSWETKLLRSDLIEAQSRITQLKKEIQHQSTIQTELEMKFATKEKALENEKNCLKNKTSEYERVLKKNRRNESLMKEEIVKLKNQITIQKQNFDQQIFELQNENESLKEELIYTSNELNNRISEINRENAELTTRLITAETEAATFQTSNKDLRQKLEEFKSLKTDFEQEKIKHQEALLKIKDLEYEVSSFGDWKDMAKASQSRMNTMSDIEKEVTRLRQVNKNLHDSLGNKLLLEEENYSLKTRLERLEQSSVNQIKLETHIDALQKELKEWKQLGVDFVQKGAANNPINVRSYIEQLMHRDLLLVSEKTSFSSEKSTMESQKTDLKNQNDSLVKQNESLEKSLKVHQSVITKLQRKLKLVQSERDAHRQLLDSYEKDLTVTQGAQTISSQETQFRLRIDMLTNSLAGYKELCAKLEAEMAELQGNPKITIDSTVCSNEQYKILRKDLEVLRIENEKLRKRKSELEIEIENITLRTNVMDDERFKIIHFANNPAKIAQEQAANEVIKLRAEVERLKLRNRKLEEGNDDLNTRSNETLNMTLNIKDMQKLREEHKTLQSKYRENEEIFKSINQELREVVYMLFGYKLDRYGNSNYRITSMYADNENDELLFRLNEMGSLEMLESDYSKLLSGFMNQYLNGPNGSLPAFTSALTLELVNRMTVTSVSL
ncbi:hypothetical protein PVAND_007108 [Polypedilum vanderplanki]|uniref:Mitotic spindle assembly checkpoint protein MAD1-like protein n=1 Tax=Polypedilum vanderplanki TaxID=319348 RepID=A0A9J6C6U6_POLVA|nr:hypothetical protein PVAND_007108 [Polypedilum vanderplanki]